MDAMLKSGMEAADVIAALRDGDREKLYRRYSIE